MVCQFRIVFMWCILLVLSGISAEVWANMIPNRPESFFIQPGKPADLSWTFDKPIEDEKTLDYLIRDYRDQPIQTGKVHLNKNQVIVTVNLPQGYYEIIFPSEKQTFGLAALPMYEQKTDPFFCIDTAMSWLVHADQKNTRESLVRILKRSGIGMARERVSWGQINPKSGKWDWDSSLEYQSLLRLYKKYGIQVLELFHDTPAWMEKPAKVIYPKDLPQVMIAWDTIRTQWKDYLSALEVWNEPDIFFGGDLPADQYVPIAKTMGYLWQESPSTILLGGGVVTGTESDLFLKTLGENGLLDNIEFFSFHDYKEPVPIMENKIKRFQKWMKNYGHEGLPLWLTECGWPWKKGTSRPTPDGDAKSALYIAMKAVEAKAFGVAHYFPFVYPYYEEENNNFAMMGKEVTPLRSMAGYVQCVSALSNRHYIGKLKANIKGIQATRIFAGDDGKAVIILYTGKVSPKAVAKLPFFTDRAEGMDGRRLDLRPLKVINADGVDMKTGKAFSETTASEELPVPDGLSYVWVPVKRLEGLIEPENKQTHSNSENETQTTLPAKPISPVVLRLDIDKNLSPNSEGYLLSDPTLPKLPLSLTVWNLGKSSQSLYIDGTVRQNGKVCGNLSPVACRLTGKTSGQAKFTLDLSSILKSAGDKSVKLELTFIARDKAGNERARLFFVLKTHK